MVWFVPCFLTPFAGINNILSLATYFKTRGIEQRFALLGNKNVCNLCEKNLRNGAYGKELKFRNKICDEKLKIGLYSSFQ